MNEIESMLEKITKYNKNVQALVKHKGIGTLTSSTINAEIIDIRRFVKDGNLASYAGLVKKEHSTGFSKSGSNNTMRNNLMYNRRLKNAFMTAAKNFVQYNPDSHLSGYYRNLIKRGMSVTEARKRVARALVRVIFRLLYSLIDKELEGLEERFGRESDMANGLSQKDLDDPSNISLISGILYNLDSLTNVKRKLSDI